MAELTTAQLLAQMRKQASALGKQLEAAKAERDAAVTRADRAEQTIRTMDRQFAACRDRLDRAEAHLASLGARKEG